MGEPGLFRSTERVRSVGGWVQINDRVVATGLVQFDMLDMRLAPDTYVVSELGDCRGFGVQCHDPLIVRALPFLHLEVLPQLIRVSLEDGQQYRRNDLQRGLLIDVDPRDFMPIASSYQMFSADHELCLYRLFDLPDQTVFGRHDVAAG